MSQKERKWFNPLFEFDAPSPPKKQKKEASKKPKQPIVEEDGQNNVIPQSSIKIINHKNWMKNFDPVCVKDLAVHNKKVQEVEDWLKVVSNGNNSDMLLLTGPVGCGKTITVRVLAAKYNMKVTEWITPLDIALPSEFGDFEFREKQSTKFLNFILNAANFSSLLDSEVKGKLVMVEDFPNTFLRTPTEFTSILHEYKHRAKSPIVFICSESHTDDKNSAANIFTPSLKEQFQIQHITFNSVSVTGLKAALKRVAEIISNKHRDMYNVPTADMIDCVVNSSAGDVRSAVINLHFACLKGLSQSLETSVMIDKENKNKSTKGVRKKKAANSKYSSIGKDQTVSILHGVGRVLNPKLTETGQFTHMPAEIIEQFVTQPGSFINFLRENYLSHFSSIDDVDKAASALSDSEFLLAEWREKMCQEFGLFVAVAGLMLANKEPVSAWNPVRGPKNLTVHYPNIKELSLLDENYLYKGKVLVSDFQTYCKIISGKT